MTEVVFEGPGRAYARTALWPPPLGWVLTDIQVPFDHQGKGHGRDLMRQVLEWADENEHDLCLLIAPCGGLTYDELEAWYVRLGFTEVNGIMRRTAQRKPHGHA